MSLVLVSKSNEQLFTFEENDEKIVTAIEMVAMAMLTVLCQYYMSLLWLMIQVSFRSIQVQLFTV